MSVLHDVLSKMMLDFLEKEVAWKQWEQFGEAKPDPFTLTLDTPDFRQLCKEQSESRLSADMGGTMKYVRVVVDGVQYESPGPSDATLMATQSVMMTYPSPASNYIYSARILHNCTLPALPFPEPAPPISLSAPIPSFVPVPADISEARRRTERWAFLDRDAAHNRLNTPINRRPGYSEGICSCVDCRFETYINGFAESVGPTVRAETSDGLRQQDRDSLAAASRSASSDYVVYGGRGTVSQRTVSLPMPPHNEPAWWDGYSAPTPSLPVPQADTHPNDPRPRMPRLNDGSPRPGATIEGSISVLRGMYTRGRRPL